MSETKTVGIIGQLYEDRRTGKSGTLVKRDEEHKTLYFAGEDGNTFVVSNSMFKSYWRKAVDKTEEAEEVSSETPEQVNGDAPEPEAKDDDALPFLAEETPVVTPEHDPFEYDADDTEAGKKMTEVCEAAGRKVEVFIDRANSVQSVVLDGLTVLTAQPNGDFWNLRMLPDLFTFTNWRNMLVMNSLKFSLKVTDHLTVACTAKQVTFGSIIAAITESVADLNLYGYTDESDEEGETVE